MAIETILAWGAAGALLAAGGGESIALLTGRQRGRFPVGIARVLAAAMLAVALLWNGRFGPRPQEAALGMALGATLTHLALRFRQGNPLTDLMALLLALGATLPGPSSISLGCIYRLPLYNGLWLLLYLGGGSLIAAGAGGLELGLAALLSPARWNHPPHHLLRGWLKRATQWSLMVLGMALTLLALANWWSLGTPAGNDMRSVGVAAAWFAAAMSWQAWQLPRHAARWAAALAALAAGIAAVSLLALPGMAY